MEWKKRTNAKTYREFIKEVTGKTMEEFTDTNKNYRIQGVEKVKEILLKASREKTKITVVGDYDCDGVGSVLNMAIILQILEIPYTLIIPKRMSEGYGISDKLVERIHTSIVITIDNGIAAVEPVRKLKERNCTVIILDHHTKGDVVPNADVIIDPEAFPNSADYSHYCGAGLAFKLAEYLLPQGHPALLKMSGITAISTIGDSVPLTGDNRRIVRQGMIALNMGYTTKGLTKLMEKCKINMYSTSKDFSFYLVPCINAPGRLIDDGSIKSVQAIWCNNDNAEKLTDELIEINNRRKQIVSDLVEQADMENIKCNMEKAAILYLPEAPEGVAGLIAGRLAEKTGKPSIAMVCTKEGIIKGSCRYQEEDLHLKHALDQCQELLLKYGGHQKAAAFSLQKENLEAFKKRFEACCPEYRCEDAVYYDIEINAFDIPEVLKQLEYMQPFGEGNPEPVFLIRNIKPGDLFGQKYSYFGENDSHVRIHFKSFRATGFFMGERFKNEDMEEYPYIDIMGYLNINHHNGRSYQQMKLIDFRKSDI